MASSPPFSPSVFAVANVAMPPIQYYAALAGVSLKGDGTDESAALQSTFNRADPMVNADGAREFWCDLNITAPTAYNLGNTIARGPGSFISTYRKKVVPDSARAIVAGNNIIPALHLRHFAKALNPVVLIWSDSTGTDAANHISASEMLWAMLEAQFQIQNTGNGRTISFVNRAIGGTDITQYNATGTTLIAAGVTLPSWFSPTSAPWSGFISNQNPDLIIVDFGANNSSANTISAINNLVTFVLGLTKVPDILFCTNLPRGTQADSGSGEVTALEARDFAAGCTRSFAAFSAPGSSSGGYGYLDYHRIGCMLRDGFDPTTQIITASITSQTMALPVTLSSTQQDYDLIFTIDNTGGQAFGSSQHLDITLSALAGNILRVSQTGSNYQLIGFSGGGLTWLSALNTLLAIPNGICTIEISIRNSAITVNCDGNIAFRGLMQRGGSAFTPTISYSAGSGPANIVVTYSPSTPALTIPALTDYEMFGYGPNFPNGGNGINHPASPAYEAIHAYITSSARLNLAEAGRPTQALTAAGAVFLDADLTTLVGPSSGTYAITLAAPTILQQGTTKAIQMLSTTGTNTVTMALTNVIGGTASTTCTWNAANQVLVLKAVSGVWVVENQIGVTLT